MIQARPTNGLQGAPRVGQRDSFVDHAPFGAGLEDSWTTRSVHGGLGAELVVSLGGDREVTKPYLQNAMVFACTRRIVENLRSLPWRLMRETSQGMVEDETSALAKLLARPNPTQSAMKFKEIAGINLLLHGESFWFLIDGQSRPAVQGRYGDPIKALPRWMYQSADSRVRVVSDDRIGSLPTSYKVYNGKTAPQQFPAASVVAITQGNPYSFLRGVGPLDAVYRDVAKSFTSDRYDEGLLRNSGRPGGYLSVKGTYQPEEARALLESFRQANWTPDKSGKVALLQAGTEFKEAGFKPTDMQFSEMRERIDQNIMTVFGCTKAVLGITDDVNRANALEAHRIFWEVTMLPMVQFLRDEVQFHLLDRVQGRELEGRRLVIDTSGVSVLKEDLDSKVERTLRLVQEAGLSLRDAAELAEWEALATSNAEGIDERWIQNDRMPYEIAIDPDIPRGADGIADPGKAADPEPGFDEEIETRGEDIAEDRAEDPQADRLDAAWKAHDDFLAEREAPLAKKAKRVFEEYILAARKRLRAKAKKATTGVVTKYVATEAEIERALALNAKEWAKAMEKATAAELEGTIKAAAELLHAEVGGEGTLLSVTDPEVLDFLANKKVSLAEGATSTLAKDVQRKIVKVLAGAEEATSLSAAIAEVLKELEDEMEVMLGQMGARAEMIARTEVNSATSFARQQQMVLDEIDNHRWVSSRDGAVRTTHAAQEAVVREVGKQFPNGLKYPGDPDGSVEEIVNCRCTTLPVID